MNDILADVRPVLTTTIARWTTIAESISADRLAQAPAPGEWSARECLQHLVDTERVFSFRLRAFLDGRSEFPAFNPDRQGTRTGREVHPASLAAEFTRLRLESLESLEKVTPSDLERQARHQELGPVTLREMLNEWAAHDLMHTVQAERALMQPFIRGCGPWQVYFTAHLVK